MAKQVDAVVFPGSSGRFNTRHERTALHDQLVRRGLDANHHGHVAEAAEHFAAAFRLERRSSTLLSHVNMRLKLGECALAAACYRRMIERAGELQLRREREGEREREREREG